MSQIRSRGNKNKAEEDGNKSKDEVELSSADTSSVVSSPASVAASSPSASKPRIPYFPLFFLTFLISATVSCIWLGIVSPGDANALAYAQRSAAFFFFIAGLAHFSIPSFYLALMPPFLPFKLTLVYVSGVIESLFALFLVIPASLRSGTITSMKVGRALSLQNLGAWGLFLTLWAVFPANIYAALNESARRKVKMTRTMALVRLPMQLLFWGWMLLLTEESFSHTCQALAAWSQTGWRASVN